MTFASDLRYSGESDLVLPLTPLPLGSACRNRNNYPFLFFPSNKSIVVRDRVECESDVRLLIRSRRSSSEDSLGFRPDDYRCVFRT